MNGHLPKQDEKYLDTYNKIFFNKKIVVFFVFIMSVSLAGNLILVRMAEKMFLKLQLSRIYPLGYLPQDQAVLVKKSVREKRKVGLIFIGDSRASMWDTAPLKDRYTVYNIAHGGQTSAQVLQQVSTQKIPDSDWVIIQVGINDLHPVGGFPQLGAHIIRQLDANLASICSLFVHRGKRVVFLTLFPPDEPPLLRKRFWDPKMNEMIRKLNQNIVQLCQPESVFLIDAYKILALTDGSLKPEFRDPDFFLHVNQRAYNRLNTELIRLIRKEGESHY